MAFERTEFLKLLEESYTAYYNIIKDDLPEDIPVVFRGDYFQKDELFWLSKRITVWGNETNEFAYVFSQSRFDAEDVKKCIDYAWEHGMPRVKPHKEHQYTNVKTVFLADDFSDEAVEEIKRSKRHVEYNRAFWGYSNLITCGVNLDTESVFTNRVGSEMKKYFKKLFAAQKKS